MREALVTLVPPEGTFVIEPEITVPWGAPPQTPGVTLDQRVYRMLPVAIATAGSPSLVQVPPLPTLNCMQPVADKLVAPSPANHATEDTSVFVVVGKVIGVVKIAEEAVVAVKVAL